jgi:hypothetical protein
MKPHVCENCGKSLPDKKTFREIAISCSKNGFYTLETRRDDRGIQDEVPYCRCRTQIISRLTSVRKRRSRVKRMMAFVARFRPHEWKTKRTLLKRGAKQKYQLRAEDLALWDTEVFDRNGRPHSLEDVLDTPLVRDLLSFRRKSLSSMREFFGRFILEPIFVSLIFQPPRELEYIESYPDDEVVRLWRRRLNDEENEPDLDLYQEDLAIWLDDVE